MTPEQPAPGGPYIGSELSIRALGGIPTIQPGDDLVQVVTSALVREGIELEDGDIIAVASKVVSRAEGCFVDLGRVAPSDRARQLGEELQKDPRLVELILLESVGISRKKIGALIVRQRLGFVSANAGIDASNAAPSDAPAGTGPWVLTLPRDPDRSAATLRAGLGARFGVEPGVLVTDSWGRPFRHGTVGFAIGAAGLPMLWDRRGARDRHGRVLEATECAVGDSLAAAADLVAGQADEGRPVTLVRGLRFPPSRDSAQTLLRAAEADLYA
jgi:coenzyme F420-0:L-glutamate ligase/coenzyme F420-1:gamma-L-glutamate ligase